MAIRKTYAKTAILGTILTNVGFIFNLIYGRIIADVIPEAELGIIAALSTLSTIIIGISLLGILYTVIQKSSSSIGKKDDLHARNIMVKGILVFYIVSIPLSLLFCYFALFILNIFFTVNLFYWAIFLIIIVILTLLLRSESDALNSMVETHKSVAFTGLRRWTYWGLSLLFLFLLGSYFGILIGWIISLALFVIIGTILLVKYLRGVKITQSLPTSTYLTFGFAVFGASVIRLLGKYIDQLYILALMSEADLAQYFLVARITGALNDFSLSLVAGLIALLSVLVGISIPRMQNAHAAVIRFVLALSAPIYVVVAAFGEPIARLLMGPRYIGSGPYLTILSIAYLFDLIIVIVLLGRQSAGQNRIIPFVWGGLLTLKLLLITAMGTNSLLFISIAVLFSEATIAIIICLYLRKEMRLGIFWIKLIIPMAGILAVGGFYNWLILTGVITYPVNLVDFILPISLGFLSTLFALFIGLRIRLLTNKDISVIRGVLAVRLRWIVNIIVKIGGYTQENDQESVTP